MNPALLAGLLSFAPGLLSRLFGSDPAQAYRNRVNQLTSPQNVGRTTNQFYQQALGSPAFSQAQSQIAAGGNVAAGNVARELGSRGIGTTGTSAVLSGLIPSMIGQQQAGLRTSAYGTAQGQAQNSIQQQIEALQGKMPASQSSQLFAGGLEAFLPFLQQLFQRQTMGGGQSDALRALLQNAANSPYETPARR